MPDYRYHVVPFVGQMKAGETVDSVSHQLTHLINHYAKEGWEFYSLDNVDIEVTPGCLGMLLGEKKSYMTYNQVILRREVSAPTAVAELPDAPSTQEGLQ